MRRGYTLLEVAVVIAILGIVTTIGWSSMGSFFPRYQTNQTAKQLKADLFLLRKMSVESNRETRLRFLNHGGDCTDSLNGGGSWELSIGNKSIGSTTWDLLPEDSLVDLTDDDQSLGIREIDRNNNSSSKNVCLQEWGTILGPGLNGTNNNNSIVFSPRGWLRNPSSDFSNNGFIEAVIHNLQAMRDDLEYKITLQIASSGMVRVYSYETDYNQNQVGSSTSSSVP